MARCIAGHQFLPREPISRIKGAKGKLDAEPLHDPTSSITALHLPWPKFHPPSRGTGARMHSSLIHPDKRCMVARGRGFRSTSDAAAAACEPSVSGWQWHEGPALLPFPFQLDSAMRSDGSPMLMWTAWNTSQIRRYNQLHVRKEDLRYCDELPCGSILRKPQSLGDKSVAWKLGARHTFPQRA